MLGREIKSAGIHAEAKVKIDVNTDHSNESGSTVRTCSLGLTRSSSSVTMS
jgi:hypothetical protein